MIDTCAIEDLVQAIEGNLPDLNIERVIDISQAIQALGCGTSLSLIVEGMTEALEQHLIQHVLIMTGGNKSETARRLQIDYKTLYRKLQKYSDD